LSSFVAVVVVVEAHVIHIVDGLVHRVQCFLVVSASILLSVCALSTYNTVEY